MVMEGTGLRPSLFMSSPAANLPSPSRRPAGQGVTSRPMLSVFFDPNDLRLTRDDPVAPNGEESLAHGVLGRGIGDEDHRDWRVSAPGIVSAMRTRAAVALDDRFQRDVLLRQPLGDGGGGPGLIQGEEPDVIAAFVALHRRLVAGAEPGSRPAEGRR